jgi:hypothetical protein
MRLAWPLLAAALLLPAVSAHGPGDDHEVLADPAAAFFPTADEVQSAIAAARDHPWVEVHALGVSGDGRPITLLEITDPASPVPVGERVVTLIETQQHGNEPAGTGAAVPLLRDLLDGKGPAAFLGNQVLLLVPMSNPDGATANQRGNRDGVDINRDHVALETPEARLLHQVLDRWDVHVAVDHHEYGGTPATGLGNPVPVRIYDFDLTLMHPNHGNVRAPTRDLAEELEYDALWPAAEEAGYSVGDYGWTTVNGIKVQQTAGGPDPGILRNNFGLNNVAGLLAESFVSGTPDNPFQSAERRIAIHRLVMDTTLQWASENAGRIIEGKRESERLNLEEPMGEYVEDPARGALAPAYLTATDLSALFALHGLPVGAPVAGGFVHNVAGEERAGLVAALLHPQSSRHVADATAAQPVASAAAAEADTRGSAGFGPCVALAAVGLAFLGRRS